MKNALNVWLLGFLFAANTNATPGEYAFHAKIGPSFEIQDTDNSFKVGGDFDYEFGFGFGFNLAANLGLSSTPLFELIPAIKYDLLYFIPGTLYVLAGAGYQAYDFEEQALGMKFGSRIVLPLRKPIEFVTDIHLTITPAGVSGTPITFDWLTGLGMRY